MELEDSEGMHWARMESIIWFLIYVSMKYRGKNTYLKGIHLTLDSWILYRDKEGWKLQGEELKMAKLYGKWEGV